MHSISAGCICNRKLNQVCSPKLSRNNSKLRKNILKSNHFNSWRQISFSMCSFSLNFHLLLKMYTFLELLLCNFSETKSLNQMTIYFFFVIWPSPTSVYYMSRLFIKTDYLTEHLPELMNMRPFLIFSTFNVIQNTQ